MPLFYGLSLQGCYNITYCIVGTDVIGLARLGNFFAWSAVCVNLMSALKFLLVGKCCTRLCSALACVEV